MSDISLIRIHELQSGDNTIDLATSNAEVIVDHASYPRAYKLSLRKIFSYISTGLVKPALESLHRIAHTGNYGDLEENSIPQYLKDRQDANLVLASDETGHVAYTDPIDLLKIKTIDLD